MNNKLINLGRKVIIALGISVTLMMTIFIIYSEVFYKQSMINKKYIETKKTEQILVTEYESLKLDYISETQNENLGLKDKIREIDLKKLNKENNKYR